jgi:hypothetical protein
MQIRSKPYLQFISLWRSFRDLISPHCDDVPAETSPSLIYTAVVLAFLLAILEVDVHRSTLESTGFASNGWPIDPIFMGP